MTTAVEMALCLQLEAGLLRIHIECAGLKEYSAPWMKGGGKVVREGGKFAKGSGSGESEKASTDDAGSNDPESKSPVDKFKSALKNLAAKAKFDEVADKLSKLGAKEKAQAQTAFKQAVDNPKVQALAKTLKQVGGDAAKKVDETLKGLKSNAEKTLKGLHKNLNIAAKSATDPDVLAGAALIAGMAIGVMAISTAGLMAVGFPPLLATVFAPGLFVPLEKVASLAILHNPKGSAIVQNYMNALDKIVKSETAKMKGSEAKDEE